MSKFHTQGKGQGPILITSEGHHLLNTYFLYIHISKKIAKYLSVKYVNFIIGKKTWRPGET